jgi:hypothetical protein
MEFDARVGGAVTSKDITDGRIRRVVVGDAELPTAIRLIPNRSNGRVQNRGIRVEDRHCDRDRWLEREGLGFGAMAVKLSGGRRVEQPNPIGICRAGNTIPRSFPP